MYCGDGINDLVALAAADVGMAVGASHASAAASLSDQHASVQGMMPAYLPGAWGWGGRRGPGAQMKGGQREQQSSCRHCELYNAVCASDASDCRHIFMERPRKGGEGRRAGGERGRHGW